MTMRFGMAISFGVISIVYILSSSMFILLTCQVCGYSLSDRRTGAFPLPCITEAPGVELSSYVRQEDRGIPYTLRHSSTIFSLYDDTRYLIMRCFISFSRMAEVAIVAESSQGFSVFL